MNRNARDEMLRELEMLNAASAATPAPAVTAPGAVAAAAQPSPAAPVIGQTIPAATVPNPAAPTPAIPGMPVAPVAAVAPEPVRQAVSEDKFAIDVTNMVNANQITAESCLQAYAQFGHAEVANAVAAISSDEVFRNNVYNHLVALANANVAATAAVIPGA